MAGRLGGLAFRLACRPVTPLNALFRVKRVQTCFRLGNTLRLSLWFVEPEDSLLLVPLVARPVPRPQIGLNGITAPFVKNGVRLFLGGCRPMVLA